MREHFFGVREEVGENVVVVYYALIFNILLIEILIKLMRVKSK